MTVYQHNGEKYVKVRDVEAALLKDAADMKYTGNQMGSILLSKLAQDFSMDCHVASSEPLLPTSAKGKS